MPDLTTEETDPESASCSGSYVGVWDSERECWVANEDDPTSPVRYTHPFFAKGMLDMYAGSKWKQQERYEIRPLPEDKESPPLAEPT